VDVTVCVGTYGDPLWSELAGQAIRSAEAEGVPVVHCDGIDLADARNGALVSVRTEWVCFLDADDELEPGYFDAMARATGDVRAPAVRYVRPGRSQDPYVPRVAGHDHGCDADCLDYGNWLVIGSVVRADLVRSVDGFRDFNWSEDWDLWVRCRDAGATFAAVPDAIYRAHVRSDSRNRAPARAAKMEAHRAIARANGLPVPA
jgi:glycosyltransferase involved in cell wall biosynthesis